MRVEADEILPSWLKFWNKIDFAISKVESLFLMFALAGMSIFTFSQIILRNFFSSGVLWFDPLVRHLLLVPVFIGASLATYEKHHIHIDALAKFFKGNTRHIVNIVASLAPAIICYVLLRGGLEFVKTSMASGDRIDGFFPSWIAQSVMPYGFFMMMLRFGKQALIHILRFVQGKPPEIEPPIHTSEAVEYLLEKDTST